MLIENPRMLEKVRQNLCIDVSKCPRMDDGAYLLPKFVQDVDYCALEYGLWIWSIGQHNLSGRLFAATDNRYYQNPFYKCVWLR